MGVAKLTALDTDISGKLSGVLLLTHTAMAPADMRNITCDCIANRAAKAAAVVHIKPFDTDKNKNAFLLMVIRVFKR